MDNRLLLTIPEAAERLSVGKTFIREQFINTGRLPVIRIGRAVRVKADELERLVEELSGKTN